MFKDYTTFYKFMEKKDISELKMDSGKEDLSFSLSKTSKTGQKEYHLTFYSNFAILSKKVFSNHSERYKGSCYQL